eukprot:CAMPEP_0197395594 /NCGR_PEP_ID=MMETSP1165-20131217/7162_1 /TAXON_ID=284809 /ORGANISM="Chrysocystis fragilis, Strain CCMP3189" /LENGTH=400 /DNA_ID=CAMNT_0042921359 /DNA_START=63 /DNA_END=1262 /DNA_ORIENTATION=-
MCRSPEPGGRAEASAARRRSVRSGAGRELYSCEFPSEVGKYEDKRRNGASLWLVEVRERCGAESDGGRVTSVVAVALVGVGVVEVVGEAVGGVPGGFVGGVGDFVVVGVVEFSEELELALGEGVGDPDVDVDDLVAASAGRGSGEAPAAEAELGARLGARWDLEVDEAVDGEDVDGRAERGLRDGDVDGDVDVGVVPREVGVVVDLNVEIEVALRGAAVADGAVARHAHLHARVDAGRDVGLERLLLAAPAVREELVPLDRFRGDPPRRLHEREPQTQLDVRPASRPARPAEEVREQILEFRLGAPRPAPPPERLAERLERVPVGGTAAHRLRAVPEPVVHRALLIVPEHLVRLARLHKLLLVRRARGVRVVLLRQPQVGLLDLLLRRRPRHPQHLVVVP